LIGIILAGHGGYPGGLLNAAQMLLKDIRQMKAVSLLEGESGESYLKELRDALGEVEDGDGTLILADFVGGTPCNCATQLVTESVRLIAGMNMQFLLEAIVSREEINDPKALVQECLVSSRLGFQDLSQIILEKRKEEE